MDEKPGSGERAAIRWERSDIIAAIALIVAAISAFFSWLNYSAQFGEKLTATSIDAEEAYVFPYKVVREGSSKPFLEKVAQWSRIRLANNSSRPISVTDIKYREDTNSWSEIPMPLATNLIVSENKISAKKFIDLPFRMDVGETDDFFVLVPLSVSRHLGEYLFPLFRETGNPIDTQIEVALLDPNFFKKMQSEIIGRLRRKKISKYIIPEGVIIDATRMTRKVFRKTSEGNWSFRDPNNESKDGFRWRDALALYNSVNNEILSSKNETIKVQEAPTHTVEFAFFLSSGTIEYLTVYRSKMALDRLRSSVSEKIF